MPVSEPATKRATLSRALPALLLLALFVALLAPALDPSVQFFYRDTGRLYYPVKKFIAEELRAGHFPLWDRWTESGTSLLAQVTPGLFHPFTLLYALLPFDLAFKLNHLLALPLAALGTFLLARRLGTSAWGAAAAAAAYGGCGFLVSMASSNLPYAVGPASVPLAIDGLLRFLERPRPGQLLWAGFALALPALAGEPQSMLFAGVIGTAIALARAIAGGAPGAIPLRLRRGLRSGLLTALWGLVALGLSAPMALPAAARLRESPRVKGVSAGERGMFLVVPWRLPGYLVPYAFDDPGEVFDSDLPERKANPYREYFSLETVGAFSDSIVIGAPALLLALLGCFSGRKGRFLFAGALLFMLASAGDTLGAQDLLMAAVPGFRYFRYAEKFAGPTALLFSLCAGLGLDFALAGTRRAARALCGLALGLAAAAGGAALLIPGLHAPLLAWVTAAGHLHERDAGIRFLGSLVAGLSVIAALSLTLGLAALLALRGARWAPALGALCCCASVLTCNTESLLLAPVELMHGPFPLADALLARGGPSEGRWRVFRSSDAHAVPLNRVLGERVAALEGIAQSLIPQFEMLSRIEGASSYFSSPDKRYTAAFEAAPYQLCLVTAVRFVVAQPYDLTASGAAERGFERMPRGYWLRELPLRPHAFVAGAARTVADEAMSAALTDPAFSPTTEALVSEADAPALRGIARHARAPAGSARWSREGPNAMSVSADARAPALLVVAEHYDPGWRASVDGAPAPLLRVDDAVLGVPLTPGAHLVKLRFVPIGLLPGLLACASTLAALGAWNVLRRTVRVSE